MKINLEEWDASVADDIPLDEIDKIDVCMECLYFKKKNSGWWIITNINAYNLPNGVRYRKSDIKRVKSKIYKYL